MLHTHTRARYLARSHPPGSLTPAGTPIAVDASYAFYGAGKGGISEPAIIVRQRVDALGPGD